MKKKQPVEQAEQQKKKTSKSTWLLIGLMVLGILIIAYPTVSDKWNSYHSTRAIASYAKRVEETDPALVEAMIQAAQEYNATLPGKENLYALTDEELETYNSLLDLSGTGLMGYIRINSIHVNIPVYHTTKDAVLQTAVGHLEWSSFPVEGESTHAVLSGHRGLPSARLLTDLDRLKEGDVFTITILNRTITYEVDQIRIVMPEDLSELTIEPGKELCTLVTCTPYGVNTHRLLVRGHRIENLSLLQVDPDAKILPNYVTIPAVGIPLMFLFLMYMLITAGNRRPTVTDSDLEKIKEIHIP